MGIDRRLIDRLRLGQLHEEPAEELSSTAITEGLPWDGPGHEFLYAISDALESHVLRSLHPAFPWSCMEGQQKCLRTSCTKDSWDSGGGGLLVFYPQPGTQYAWNGSRTCVLRKGPGDKSLFFSHLCEVDKEAPPRGLGLVPRHLLSGMRCALKAAGKNVQMYRGSAQAAGGGRTCERSPA